MLVRIYFTQKDFDRAIEHLEKVRKQAPEDIQALFYLGNAYLQIRKNDAGLQVVQAISQMATGNVKTKLALGVMLFRNGLYREASQELQKVIWNERNNVKSLE